MSETVTAEAQAKYERICRLAQNAATDGERFMSQVAARGIE